LRERYGLPPLAVAYYHEGTPLPLPAPLEVPFGPLELDESRAPLADLMQAVHTTAAVTPSPSWRCTLLRLGFSAGVAGLLVAYVFFHLLTSRASVKVWSEAWLWSVVVAAFVLPGLAAALLSDQWFLVPGGVVTRRRLFGRAHGMLRRYTPQDTTLIVRPRERETWQIELWRGLRARKREATALEVVALLAAWQSPLPTPPLERLDDLR